MKENKNVNDLVRVIKSKAFVSSRAVAEKFGKQHNNVLRAIANLEIPNDFRMLNFEPSIFKTSTGKEYTEYLMTRTGFSILVMGFTGKEAMQWKIKFIEAFDLMERELIRLKVQNTDVEWKAAREQGKLARRAETDIIQKFVEYAEKQGSKNARRYYQHYTNLAYTATNMVDKASEGVSTGYRDFLNKMEVNQIECAERIATHWIAKGMEQGLEYHDIYALVREKVIETMAITMLPTNIVNKTIDDNISKPKTKKLK